MLAFLSYQTADRHVAAEVSKILGGLSIDSFMAHEDIEVSHEWHDVILEKIAISDLFVAIISKNYLASAYCLQESGIAVFRNPRPAIIPLSIDGTIPPGFMNRLQSKKVTPGKISYDVIIAGIAKYAKGYAIDLLINELSKDRSYAAAEFDMALLKPYLPNATEQQIVKLLQTAEENNQVYHARECRPVLREILKSHGHLLSEELRESLDEKMNG